MVKQKLQRKKNINIAGRLLIAGFAGSIGITGCGGNTGIDMPATEEAGETIKGSVEDMTIEDYEAMLSNEEAVFAGMYEVEQMPEVELADPIMLPTEEEILWDGYSEEALGLLEPHEMPNCEMEAGCHYIDYNGRRFYYVDVLNMSLGEDSPYAEYSKIWVTNDGDEMKVLGGWEEYGRTGNLVGGKTE